VRYEILSPSNIAIFATYYVKKNEKTVISVRRHRFGLISQDLIVNHVG